MLVSIMKSKIHRATVTDSNLNYIGSITIDAMLMKEAGIFVNEKVQVVDVTNGNRLETYAIEGESGSGSICLNGAAARLVHAGDVIIIITYGMTDSSEAPHFTPKIVHVDGKNKIIGGDSECI
ncbi:MAG: aspartate 1-decarboxylase [Treponema sp.]|nr:aspartate 1-decarboxylase [Treponema sp.]